MLATHFAVELAHAARNQGVAFQDLRCSARIDICRPVAEFMAAAEDHAIAARKHVEIEYRIEIGVGDGRLRLDERDLALERREFRIAEQGLGADAGAIDDERLAESLELGFARGRALLSGEPLCA